MVLNDKEREELEELRRYKMFHEHNALDRAFTKLEGLLNLINFDPVMSPRVFRVLGDCLLALRDEVRKS